MTKRTHHMMGRLSELEKEKSRNEGGLGDHFQDEAKRDVKTKDRAAKRQPVEVKGVENLTGLWGKKTLGEREGSRSVELSGSVAGSRSRKTGKVLERVTEPIS